MISKEDFVAEVVRAAHELGYKVESSARNGLPQIDFGNKKLHAGHLQSMYPAILEPGANIATLVDHAAPGRPCAHRPMREIVELLRKQGKC